MRLYIADTPLEPSRVLEGDAFVDPCKFSIKVLKRKGKKLEGHFSWGGGGTLPQNSYKPLLDLRESTL